MGAPTPSACPLSREELETCCREKLSAPNKKSNINKCAPYTGKVDDGSLMKPIEGFRAAIPGCNENIVVLENVIKGAKYNHKDLAVVFVDLAKAFDSVGHKLLIKSLQRVKLPKAFVSLIEDLYTGNTTVVEGNGNLTTPITIERGIKQGDPLSPILFNIALDQLVCSLERANSGVSMPLGGRRVNCSTLAFADDIALLSDSHMARNLKLLQAYCDHTGLSDTEKYLGARIDPWAGVAEGDWEEKLKSWVKGIQAAPLRPRQRLEILKIHAIPRLYFHLILTEASQATLTKLDQRIRNATKEFLHLPPHIADGVLYVSNRNGGLGVPKLGVQIPSVIVRKREVLDMSSDVVIQASFQYKGESNTETVAGLRELKVLKEIENVQPSNRSSGEGKIDPMTTIQDIMPALQEANAGKEQKIVVVDDTVRYENDSEALETAWREKQEKYKHLNAKVMELTGGVDPKYFGFVMGARGKWLGINNRLIKLLGIERYDTFAQKTSRLTLSLTLELLQLFSDKTAKTVNCAIRSSTETRTR
ncbi:hypothetical protein chiPu_0017124 [Chiloscyllium punctatum]|uniref:Reverse transcriptase domain-containing protein n=1 Tax=Chiloscyllium punctatum TaxID=137246 RepID=A0A401T7I8_CHIPU|nr:hypothetical protein [Chiloscyllium punctatum]